jgi:hypothetical protein
MGRLRLDFTATSGHDSTRFGPEKAVTARRSRRMRSVSSLALAAGALTIVALAPATAAPASRVSVDYGLWLAGLPLGNADLAGTFDGNDYKVEIRVRLTGLAGMITGGRGQANAAGTLAGARPQPQSYAVTSRSSKEQRTVRVGLAAGNVAAVEIVPPIEPKPDTVPVTAAHKRGVIDPVSAIVMPFLGRGEPTDAGNCDRTVPVFDGAARFNIVLSYAETKQLEKPGYKGPVLVCNVRYVPVAGHRAEHPGTKFMEDNREMSVWLAPVEGTRVLVPIRIAVATQIGSSVIEASRWSLEGGAKPIPTSASARERAGGQ